MRINSLPIIAKAFAGSAVLLISLVWIGALAVQSLNSLAQRLETSAHSTIAKGSSKERMTDALSEAHLNLFRFMAGSSNRMTDSMLDRVRSEISRSEAAVEARLAHLAGRNDLSPVEREEVRGFAESWKRYLAAARQAIEVALAEPAEAMMLLGAVDDEFQRANLHLRRLTAAARSQNRIVVEALRGQASADARLIEIGGVVAILLALAIAFFFARSIISPIRAVTWRCARSRSETSIFARSVPASTGATRSARWSPPLRCSARICATPAKRSSATSRTCALRTSASMRRSP